MKQFVWFALVLLAIVSVGCNSKELTRSKAAKIIKENVKFPDPVLDTMNMGQITVQQTSVEQLYAAPLTGKFYKALTDAGLVRIELKRVEPVPGWLGGGQHGIFLGELTDKGSKYVVETPQSKLVPTTKTIRLCDKEFDEVTGITMIEPALGGGAKVEYNWKFTNKTPFEMAGEGVLGADKTACGTNAPRSGSVVMKLYDDGWRYAQ